MVKKKKYANDHEEGPEEYVVDINGDGIPDIVRVYKRKNWYNNVRVANIWFGSYLQKRKRKTPGTKRKKR